MFQPFNQHARQEENSPFEKNQNPARLHAELITHLNAIKRLIFLHMGFCKHSLSLQSVLIDMIIIINSL